MQRGNNGQPIVMDDTDARALVELVISSAVQADVALHAYVVVATEFQVLATPSTATSMPAFMQTVGRKYVRHFNDRHARSGTLWEGRYRSTLVQPERYGLPVMVYMDLLPVETGAVLDPAAHDWSSHRHYAGETAQRAIAPHPVFWSLGNTPFAREQAYRQAVAFGLSASERTFLFRSLRQGWPLGDNAYLAKVADLARRRVEPKRPGRPAGKPVPNISTRDAGEIKWESDP
jgi:putative transposase